MFAKGSSLQSELPTSRDDTSEPFSGQFSFNPEMPGWFRSSGLHPLSRRFTQLRHDFVVALLRNWTPSFGATRTNCGSATL
jgi:hypothetical protein